VAFVRTLARSRDEVLARLKALRTALSTGNGDLADLFDEEAVRTVERQVDILWPYLRRLPPRKD
jgi:hypothetical protein